MRHAACGKNNSIRKLLVFVIVAVLGSMTVCMGCGNKDTEADQPSQEQEQEETLWGDASFGIDPKVDEELQNYRTIILYGIDNGNRSDIIMFISINKKTNDAKVFSVNGNSLSAIMHTDTAESMSA